MILYTIFGKFCNLQLDREELPKTLDLVFFEKSGCCFKITWGVETLAFCKTIISQQGQQKRATNGGRGGEPNKPNTKKQTKNSCEFMKNQCE